MVDAEYRTRIIDGPLQRALETEPAIIIEGPRGVGKTTTARRHAATTVSLDDPRQAAPFRTDPQRALSNHDYPLVIDEWQFVPDVMWAVKRAVDEGAAPGSFILTGSVNTRRTDRQPVFGRTRQLTMWPATYPEIHNIPTTGLADLFDTPLTGCHPSPSTLNIDDYHQAIINGGYPRVAFAHPPAPARAADMLADITDLDALELSPRAHIGKLAAWLYASAVQSAQSPSLATMFDQVGINRKTAERYDQLLQEMYILELITPYFDNRFKRLRRAPKRYMTDTGLTCAALRISARDLSTDPALAGHLLDTFVAAQLRAMLPTANPAVAMHHLRTDSGAEVDIVLTSPGGVIGIEVTATPNPDMQRTPGDARKARHLAALRDQLGGSFTRGLLLHTGPDTYLIDDRILATPISSLWTVPSDGRHAGVRTLQPLRCKYM